MRTTSRLRASVLGVLVVALVSACGGQPAAEPVTPTESPDGGGATAPAAASPSAGGGATTGAAPETIEEVLTAVDGLTGEERQRALEELALAEGGTVTLYTSMTEELAGLLADAFGADTGVDVDVYRAQSGTVTQRLIEEVRSGYANGADVAESAAADMGLKSSEGALVAYEPPYADELLEGSVYDGWVATRLNLFVPNWNTNAVSAEEAPASWEDLADPVWDGRMAMEREDYDWYMIVRDHWLEDGRSQEEVQALFRDMADGAVPVDGHSTAAELLAAGEFELFAHNYSYLVEAAKKGGAPLEWRLVEPVPVQPNGVGLVTNAPHPAAAVLLFDWLLSERGQQVILDYNLVPSLERMVPSEYVDADLRFLDLDRFLSTYEELTAEYDELMRIAGDSG